MLCWLLVVIWPVGGGLGRSENMAPFWTRLRWTREWLLIKMEEQEPILRLMMGPYLSIKPLRMGSISPNDLVSHSKLPIIGTVRGPGGSFFLV